MKQGAPEVQLVLLNLLVKRYSKRPKSGSLDHAGLECLSKLFPNADVPVFQF